MFVKHHDSLAIAVRLADVSTIWLAGFLATELRFSPDFAVAAPIHQFIIYFSCVVALIVLPRFDLYTSWRGRSFLSLVARLVAAWSLVWLIGILMSFLMHQAGSLSRLWAAYWYAGTVVALLALRIVTYSLLSLARGVGRNAKHVLIVGFGITGQEMYRRATASRWSGFRVAGIYAGPEDATPESIPRIEDSDHIAGFARKHHVDEIWITLPIGASRQMQSIAYTLRNDFIDIKWMPSLMEFELLNHRMQDFMGMPAVELNRPPSLGVRGLVKGAFDRTFAAVVLTLLSPLLVAIALLIKRGSPGPAFFKQERLGLDGRVIHVYKFRSMKVHTEHETVTQARKGDSRVTPIGAFLRRTSLDELPQFINVLRGEMSVVGPRPHAMAHNDMYKEQLDLYMLRHRVKPGITGWAQINGYRGETDTLDKMAKRVEHDIFYIRNWSFGMDLKIIFWTTFRGWTGRNAY
ncbi:undecaprenyl-phosphate glucose phosphotransferase [Cupriavidus yeoncheonensis]|nr:undecaprenyl-phosphate glucose phosphotransferase [Cupriavidus yeoncheonensis]